MRSYLARLALNDEWATGSDLVRFVPNPDFYGTATIDFRAWDTTDGNLSGTAGVDASTGGGTQPFSTATETATITINPINDPPSLDLDADDSAAAGTAYDVTFTEGGTYFLEIASTFT